jgi:hypothetical protein
VVKALVITVYSVNIQFLAPQSLSRIWQALETVVYFCPLVIGLVHDPERITKSCAIVHSA